MSEPTYLLCGRVLACPEHFFNAASYLFACIQGDDKTDQTSSQTRNGLERYKTMSTAVQLKLLTLLNVSAIKRPRDADQPGAQRRSISVSPSVQIQPQSSNEGESSNAAGETSEEPPKKKKRGVSFGGEVGPSGSGGKKEKTSKRKEEAAAGKEQVNGASKSIPVIEEEASETDVTEGQLVAEEDSDDEAPATGTGSSVTGQCTMTT
jgi:hypothetical protein